MNVGIDLLKLLAGLAVLFMAAAVAGLFGRAKAQKATPGPDFGVGVLSGVMCTSLAMPGPVPAAWMSARSLPKATIRATTLALFVFSYVAAFVFQAGLAGVEEETWWLTASLVPGHSDWRFPWPAGGELDQRSRLSPADYRNNLPPLPSLCWPR